MINIIFFGLVNIDPCLFEDDVNIFAILDDMLDQLLSLLVTLNEVNDDVIMRADFVELAFLDIASDQRVLSKLQLQPRRVCVTNQFFNIVPI